MFRYFCFQAKYTHPAAPALPIAKTLLKGSNVRFYFTTLFVLLIPFFDLKKAKSLEPWPMVRNPCPSRNESGKQTKEGRFPKKHRGLGC